MVGLVHTGLCASLVVSFLILFLGRLDKQLTLSLDVGNFSISDSILILA